MRNILLDAGVKVGTGSFTCPGFHLLPAPGLAGGLEDIDAVLVSHAHRDHPGTLPLVVGGNPGALALASDVNKELL